MNKGEGLCVYRFLDSPKYIIKKYLDGITDLSEQIIPSQHIQHQLIQLIAIKQFVWLEKNRATVMEVHLIINSINSNPILWFRLSHIAVLHQLLNKIYQVTVV